MERRPKAERLAAERIGLVAGSGRFPVLFAETARRRGVEVVAVAHLGETDPAIETPLRDERRHDQPRTDADCKRRVEGIDLVELR